MRNRLSLGLTAALALTLGVAPGALAAGVRGEPVTISPVTGPPPAEDRSGPRQAPLRSAEPSKLTAAKRRASARAPAGTSFRSAPRAKAFGPLTAVFGGLNQPGLAATDNVAFDVSPPDTTGSISPSNYIEAVNHRIAIYNRGTLASSPIAAATTEGFAGIATFNCDPQIKWDAQAGRWFYTVLDCDGAGDNHLMFGWSKTATPSNLTTDWCKFSVNTLTSNEDYPKVGWNNSHWMIGTNAFAPGFVGSHLFTIPKPAAGDTSCTVPTATFFSTAAWGAEPSGGEWFTPVPADTIASTSNGYVVMAQNPLFTASPGDANQIGVWHVTAANTLVFDGLVSVGLIGVPPDVPQLPPALATDNLDSLDSRLTQAVAAPDPNAGGTLAVWTQHTVAGASGATSVRWYEIVPGSTPPRQQGTIAPEAGRFAFNAAISPAANGRDAVIQYNVGGSDLLTQIRAQSRRGTTPLGQMRREIVVGTSIDVEGSFACPSPTGSSTRPSCRWGDYAGASPDPSNPNVVWGSNQLNTLRSGTSARWVTRNFALQVPPNVAPTISISGPASASTAGPAATFSATTADSDIGPVQVAWDLDGDGQFDDAAGSTAASLFTAPGSSTVRAVAVDEDGALTTGSKTLTVIDRTPAGGKLSVSKPRLGKASSANGFLRVTLTVNEAVRAQLFVLVDRKTAKRLKLRGKSRKVGKKRFVTIGSAKTRLTKAGKKKLRVKLSRRNRRRLAFLRRRGLRSLKATLLASLTDAAGNGSKVTKRIKLKR